jgi:hypothetical protein
MLAELHDHCMRRSSLHWALRCITNGISETGSLNMPLTQVPGSKAQAF